MKKADELHSPAFYFKLYYFTFHIIITNIAINIKARDVLNLPEIEYTPKGTIAIVNKESFATEPSV